MVRTLSDIIVLHLHEIPYPDGLDTEFEILFPKELENQIQDIDEYNNFIEELRTSEEWECILSEQALSFDYIEVYKRKATEE